MVRPSSIRTRLLTALFAGSIVIIFFGAGFAYTLVKKYLYAEVDHFLRDKLSYQQIAAVQNGERISFHRSGPVLERLRDPKHPDLFQFRFLDGRDIYSSSGLDQDLPQVGLTADDYFKAYDCDLPNGRRGRCMGMVFIPEQLIENLDAARYGPVRIHLVVARDRAEIDMGLRRLRELLAFMGIAVALSALGATTLIVRKALRPMEELSSQIESTPIGVESSRIYVRNAPSEIQPVIDRLNHLLARVSSAIENERQFTANAAHELRNPLAGLKTQLELALGACRDPEADELVLAQSLKIQEQMEGLVSNLLMLARLDSGSEEFNVGKITPALALRQCWKPYFETAEDRDVQVKWNVENAPENFRISPALFKMMFSNLLGNAVSYVPRGGQILVEAETEGKSLVISISNSNPGVTESNLAKLFQRFQRGDASAAGGGGHAGIGLSLCQRIVKTIKGHVVATVDSQWFKITVKIPEATI